MHMGNRLRKYISINAIIVFGFSVLGISNSVQAQDVRIKDLVNVRGVRSNQLMGVGLVVGLNKSGDSAASLSTNKATAAMLQRMGLKVTDQQVTGGNAALVMVTVDLPSFSRNGDHASVRVSTLGDAKALSGGILMSTALKGTDTQVYGMAQGPVGVGQDSGTGVQVQTVATVPNGLTVEREFVPVIDRDGVVTLSLIRPDFTTNRRMVESINKHFKGFFANSVDIHAVSIEVPAIFSGRPVDFMSEVEGLKVVFDQKAVVVINERTGTIVMGGDVLVSPVTIAHGDLTISVGGSGGGKKNGASIVKVGGSSVSKLIEGLNAMGMKPTDLIGVMQALQSAGALQGELQFM